MNLMYFKNLRGDRDGGTTGLLSGGRRVTAGFDGGGGSYGGGASSGTGYGSGYGPQLGLMRGMGSGVGASGSNIGGSGNSGGNSGAAGGSRGWFNSGAAGPGGGGARSGGAASSSSAGTSSHLATVGATATGAGLLNIAGVSSVAVGAIGGNSMPTIISGPQGNGVTINSNGTGCESPSSATMQGQHGLRTHPLGLFDLPRHQLPSDQSTAIGSGVGGGVYDDDQHQMHQHQRGGGGRNPNSAGASGGLQQRWSHQQYVERGDTRADYRYTRVDRQHMQTAASSSANRTGGAVHHHGGGGSQQESSQLLPNDVSTAAVTAAAGSRSVRSGLYDTEVCLSVSGLGNVRGTMAGSGPTSGGGGGGGGSGRSGKQVSFGRYSPDVQQMMMMNSGGGGGVGTIERERSRDSDSMMTVGLRSSANDKRSSRTSMMMSGNSAAPGGGVAGNSNKENSNGELSMTGSAAVRSTFPRSSIVASKRSSPERLLAADSSGRGGSGGGGAGGHRRDDSADSSRSHRSRRTGVVSSGRDTAETSLTLSLPDPAAPSSRHQQRGGGVARRGGADNSRSGSVYHDPIFDDLIDPKDLNLNEIPRDCFIIPVHLVNRFLPLGVTLPQTGRASMSVVEVDEPQLVILLHFMTPFMAIQPVFESPLARPASLQGQLASQLLIDLLRDRPGSHGMLLVSIEQDVDYPYINYGIASRQQTNGEDWQQTARLASLERFDPQNLRYFSDHLVDVYEEAATIARPPLQPHCRRPLSNKTGYIVCVYKVFEGDDGEKFERNWLYWTGARILYQCVPRCVGLRRITLHKTVSAGDKLYTLMCECSSFMDHLQEAAYIAPALRARLCGYWSIYRVAEVY